MSRDDFDGGYHLYAREKYKERVAKNPDRVAYAKKLLTEHGIKFEVKNEAIGHFHCYRKSDGKLIQFWAGTGKIFRCSRRRGIRALVAMCEEGAKNVKQSGFNGSACRRS